MGATLAGEFVGNLSDGGEIVRMIDGSANIITLFAYQDLAPWPLPPDGDGPALVLKAPDLDPTIGSNWRASYSTGGKPGSIDVLSVAEWRARHFTAADLADPAKESTLWGNLADRTAMVYEHCGIRADRFTIAFIGRPELMTECFRQSHAPLSRATYRLREGTTRDGDTAISSDLTSWNSNATVISGPSLKRRHQYHKVQTTSRWKQCPLASVFSGFQLSFRRDAFASHPERRMRFDPMTGVPGGRRFVGAGFHAVVTSKIDPRRRRSAALHGTRPWKCCIHIFDAQLQTRK